MVTTCFWCFAVDDVDQRRQRGTLAAPGGPGHQHQPLARVRQFGQGGRQVQRFQRGNARRQQPDARRQRAALVMDIDAEAAQPFAHEAEVHALPLLQFVQLRLVQQGKHQVAYLFGFQRRASRRGQRALHAQHRRCAHHQQHVRSSAAHRQAQQLIQRRRGCRRAHHRYPLLARRRPVQFGHNLGKLAIVLAHSLMVASSSFHAGPGRRPEWKTRKGLPGVEVNSLPARPRRSEGYDAVYSTRPFESFIPVFGLSLRHPNRSASKRSRRISRWCTVPGRRSPGHARSRFVCSLRRVTRNRTRCKC